MGKYYELNQSNIDDFRASLNEELSKMEQNLGITIDRTKTLRYNTTTNSFSMKLDGYVNGNAAKIFNQIAKQIEPNLIGKFKKHVMLRSVEYEIYALNKSAKKYPVEVISKANDRRKITIKYALTHLID